MVLWNVLSILDVVCAVSDVKVCALEWNNASVTLFYMFVVMSAILFEQMGGLKYSVMYVNAGHGNVGVFSNWSDETSTCMCGTNIIVHSLVGKHSLKSCSSEEILEKKVLKLIATKVFVCCRARRVYCARVWTVWRVDMQNTSFKLHWLEFIPTEKYLSCSTWCLVSVLLACVPSNEPLH